MSEIIFNYQGHEIPIQCSEGEKIKIIMERLHLKLKTEKNSLAKNLNFIYALH